MAGPEKSNAPFTKRNAVWLYDAHLERTSLRTPSIAGLDRHLYVFQGEILVNSHRLIAGDSLIILGAETVEISAPESADLILLDAQLLLETYNLLYEREDGDRVTRRGFGDTTLRLKYNFWGNDGGRTAFAATP